MLASSIEWSIYHCFNGNHHQLAITLKDSHKAVILFDWHSPTNFDSFLITRNQELLATGDTQSVMLHITPTLSQIVFGRDLTEISSGESMTLANYWISVQCRFSEIMTELNILCAKGCTTP